MTRPDYRILVGIAAILMLAASTVPVFAGDGVERPFEFSIESAQVIDGQGNSFTVIGTGQATHMGAVTFVNEVKRMGDRAIALRTIEAADGDLLYLYHETEYDEILGRYVGTYEILGGTGKFDGASGSGVQIQGIGCSGTICY